MVHRSSILPPKFFHSANDQGPFPRCTLVFLLSRRGDFSLCSPVLRAIFSAPSEVEGRVLVSKLGTTFFFGLPASHFCYPSVAVDRSRVPPCSFFAPSGDQVPFVNAPRNFFAPSVTKGCLLVLTLSGPFFLAAPNYRRPCVCGDLLFAYIPCKCSL